jgi:glucose-6-phosphate dehydrogenase assembly protein OpcA
MITLLLVGAALAYLFWPRGAAPAVPAAADLFRVPPQVVPATTPAAAPDARAAIDSLLAVRDRLAAAGPLDEESSKSVDRLWLELLHGSAKR